MSSCLVLLYRLRNTLSGRRVELCSRGAFAALTLAVASPLLWRLFESLAEGTVLLCNGGSSSVSSLAAGNFSSWIGKPWMGLELIAGHFLKETPCRRTIKKLGCKERWVRPTEYKSLEVGGEIIPYPAGIHLENCAPFIGWGDTVALRNTSKEQL